MKCTVCNSEMITRHGKFGEFWCCPKSNPKDNHGTISKAAPNLNRTNSMMPAARQGNFVSFDDPLTRAIERQMMAMGGGYLSDMDRFLEGGQLDAADDDSHWLNTREY